MCYIVPSSKQTWEFLTSPQFCPEMIPRTAETIPGGKRKTPHIWGASYNWKPHAILELILLHTKIPSGKHIAIENGHLWWIYPLKIVIFHSYVKLPEGTLLRGSTSPILRQPHYLLTTFFQNLLGKWLLSHTHLHP